MFKLSIEALKAGLRRGGKTLFFLALAGLVTQSTQTCQFLHSLLPGSIDLILSSTGKSFELICTGILASLGAGIHKAVTFKN